jgi:hypothetical protein
VLHKINPTYGNSMLCHLAGLPIGLQEYFAVTKEGDLILLAMNIAPIYRNAFGTSGHNITISIKDEQSEREHGNKWVSDGLKFSLFLHDL